MPSIELLLENVDRPLMHARCQPACGAFFAVAYDAEQTPLYNLNVFIGNAKAQGWVIGLLGNMCPMHAKRARDVEARFVPIMTDIIQ